MFTDYVNNSTGFAETIKTNTSLSTISQMLGSDFQNDFLEKNLTQDQKAVLVSENLLSDSSLLPYNVSLMPESPIAESSGISNAFNELSGFLKNYRFEDPEFNPVENLKSDFPLNSEEVNSNSGFYMVLNKPSNLSGTKLLTGQQSEFQKRINSTYGLQNKKDPGMLVDLVF